MKKRVLVLTIVLALVLQTTLALATTDGQRLQDLNIIQGDSSGNLLEANYLDRSQLAKLLCSLNGVEAEAKAFSENMGFSDIPAGAWYASYVNYANKMGWMNGIGNNKFDPSGSVSEEMATTVLLRVLGYTPKWGDATTLCQNISVEILPGNSSQITRGELFTLIFDILNRRMNNSTQTLGESLNFDIDYASLLYAYVITDDADEKYIDGREHINTSNATNYSFVRNVGDDYYITLNGSEMGPFEIESYVYDASFGRDVYSVFYNSSEYYAFEGEKLLYKGLLPSTTNLRVSFIHSGVVYDNGDSFSIYDKNANLLGEGILTVVPLNKGVLYVRTDSEAYIYDVKKNEKIILLSSVPDEIEYTFIGTDLSSITAIYDNKVNESYIINTTTNTYKTFIDPDTTTDSILYFGDSEAYGIVSRETVAGEPIGSYIVDTDLNILHTLDYTLDYAWDINEEWAVMMSGDSEGIIRFSDAAILLPFKYDRVRDRSFRNVISGRYDHPDTGIETYDYFDANFNPISENTVYSSVLLPDYSTITTYVNDHVIVKNAEGLTTLEFVDGSVEYVHNLNALIVEDDSEYVVSLYTLDGKLIKEFDEDINSVENVYNYYYSTEEYDNEYNSFSYFYDNEHNLVYGPIEGSYYYFRRDNE